MKFLSELRRRNSILFYFGILNALGAIICVICWQTTNIEVAGINAFIKPLKFFLSIWIFSWTMGWYLHYLQAPRKTLYYSIMVAIVLAFELTVITWQAANGRLSHFNTTSPFHLMLFNLMGIAILILTVWTAYITYLFFTKSSWQIPSSYVWGIRLGLLFFVVFAFEGGMMAQALSHTVGGTDGSPGLPLVNWSTRHGDLRIAHFMGMHALQVIPLVGYYLTRNKVVVLGFALIYLSITVFILLQALRGVPLIGIG